MGDPEFPAMEGLPSSWMEQHRLAEIRLVQENRLMPKDLAVRLAASIAF